jgi:2,4-dienoyl-CoA reductase-like NADH-dependent reductase (Old Yellow Enzyme family)
MQDGGWQTAAPPALPLRLENHVPRVLDQVNLSHIRRQFGESAKRAGDIGLDGNEIHMATCCTSSCRH